MDMKPHHLKSECPACYYEMDCVTPMAGERTPEPGDISICINCTTILHFDDKMALQIAPDDLVECIPPYQLAQIRLAQKFIKDNSHLRKKDNAPILPGPNR